LTTEHLTVVISERQSLLVSVLDWQSIIREVSSTPPCNRPLTMQHLY